MTFGCCTQIENYPLLQTYGFGSICLAAKDIAAMSEEQFVTVLRTIKSGPLSCKGLNAYCAPDLKMTGPGFNRQAVKEYGNRVLMRASQLGLSYIGIGCPNSRNVPDGFSYSKALDQYKQTLCDLCDMAAILDIDILLESVCSIEGNFITTVKEAIEVVSDIGRPNMGLVYDIYHEFMMEQPATVAEQAGALIKTVHIAQDVGGKRHYLREEHIEEYRPYIEILREIGYLGEVNLEAFFGELETELPRSLAILNAL